jgi:drug/metabolite transporter (DMT)-like permease
MNKRNFTQGQIRQFKIIMAFSSICLIWGSTFLAIRFAVETLPPFMMASIRFLAAGTIMYGWLRLRGAPRPSLIHWRSAFIVGGLMLMGGNGGMAWAAQYLPSAPMAVLVATIPLWISVLSTVINRKPLSGSTIGSMLLAMFGIFLLVSPDRSAGDQAIHLVGVVVVLAGAFLWAMGTLYSRTAPKPSTTLLGTAMNLLAGGFLLAIFSLLNGEAAELQLSAVSLKSWLGVGYLALFGSIIAFSAYIWLMQNAEPSRVSAYAYINPLVATVLGWSLAGETITPKMLIASVIILTAVAILITSNHQAEKKAVIFIQNKMPLEQASS